MSTVNPTPVYRDNRGLHFSPGVERTYVALEDITEADVRHGDVYAVGTFAELCTRFGFDATIVYTQNDYVPKVGDRVTIGEDVDWD